MTVRVRFAPSPTGYLHIGGARTALYNYLFAKAKGGKFILRIEDTDLERSEKQYEDLLIHDLKWLGLQWDEGPDCPGEFGPYRQSERTDIYMKWAQWLIDKGLAYYDFCTDEELEEAKERAMREGRPPHYDGKWKNPAYFEEAQAKLSAGEKGAIRFRAPAKSFVLTDHVRGRVVFPENMVGDFVIVRSNGQPVYNYCCVIDDWLMKITHVIRGEDHLSNTVRQLMIYEALGAELPEFAHVSLLIGKDRQKLSKRHGATSTNLYIEEGYLPEAICNYLCLLGWSHPEEKDIFTKADIQNLFELNRLSKSPAIYDIEKFQWVNGQHLRQLDLDTLLTKANESISKDHAYHKQSIDWKKSCLNLFKDQVNFFHQFEDKLNEHIFHETLEKNEKLQEIFSWETTPKIADYLKVELSNVKDDFVTEETLNKWMDHVKNELKIKGKPLFMGVRACLTGYDHGPELKFLVPLTQVSLMRRRLEQI